MKRILHERDLNSLKDTSAFAAEVAKIFVPGSVLLLEGDLGAGKTTFTQALALQLGVTRTVTSPTFTLANEYPLPDGSKMVHFDLYRLASPEGIYDLGLEDALETGARILIEWPCRAQSVIRSEISRYFVLTLSVIGEYSRHAQLSEEVIL